MDFATFIASRQFLLTEGSIYERLRRNPTIDRDPAIYHAALIYDDATRAVLGDVHREYLDVGQSHRIPMLAFTDTWRANAERIAQSRFKGRPVNQDHARFLRQIRDGYGSSTSPIYIAGNTGPRGDAYRPDEAPDTAEAQAFHTPQIEALAEGGVDCLFAATLPAAGEALGIANAMAATGLPYVISFVLSPGGTVLDGTSLASAMARIDDGASQPPAGYSVNCVYPTAFARGLRALGREAPAMAHRLVGFQANTSARDPAELDGLDHLESIEPDRLAALMLGIYKEFGTPVLGGCCGTDTRHIASLGSAILGDRPSQKS